MLMGAVVSIAAAGLTCALIRQRDSVGAARVGPAPEAEAADGPARRAPVRIQRRIEWGEARFAGRGEGAGNSRKYPWQRAISHICYETDCGVSPTE